MKRPFKFITDVAATILFLVPVMFVRNPDTANPIPYITLLLVCAFGALYFLEDIVVRIDEE